ncbi:hypothetical protein [Ramlibacter rhizophilus]|uniref:Uncharacterized protein n=1 Tax=Ramlibacter rhizophilus TaxID=1781167 RepID=A0A4Z0BFC1_9BURK|nr:hypothetical protein [Ramlibacter rhizophilus]TFY98026.1 hypothetical protein EZ242_16390 [Ramlibacter rhizophilus]
MSRFAALLHVPERVDPLRWWLRLALWLGFAAWSLPLVRADIRSGEIASSFLHGPLLLFHEAGHVLMLPLGEWMTVFGGTLGQLAMPLAMAGVLLSKNRDPFGASLGLWLTGVSLLTIAPYAYDALHPQLILLGGHTGDDGPHDWIYLLSSLGLLPRAQGIGRTVHFAGAAVMLLSLAWGAGVLWLQRARISDGEVLREE